MQGYFYCQSRVRLKFVCHHPHSPTLSKCTKDEGYMVNTREDCQRNRRHSASNCCDNCECDSCTNDRLVTVCVSTDTSTHVD